MVSALPGVGHLGWMGLDLDVSAKFVYVQVGTGQQPAATSSCSRQRPAAAASVRLVFTLPVIRTRQGCQKPSDNAGVASTKPSPGCEDASQKPPEPRQLHWLQEDVARGRPAERNKVP